MPSASRISAPTLAMPAPPISTRWVGPHRVTSWPNIRCQTSSIGKAASAKDAESSIKEPPSGAYQSRVIFTEEELGLPPSRGSATDSRPAKKTPNSPARMK
jgi:hypothetical protein